MPGVFGEVGTIYQELKLLRSPTPLSLESGHDSEDSDAEGSALRLTATNASRDIAYPMSECNDTDEEDVSLP